MLVDLVINALIILGFHIATYETNILDFIPKILDKAPQWIKKPVYDCPTCMASVHSTYYYWIINEWTLSNLYFYPVYILALAGMATITYNLNEWLSK